MKLFIAELFYTKRRGYGEFFLDYFLKFALMGKNPCISTWHYDSIGRIARAVSDGHSYEYIYDEYGNLKEKRSNGKRLVSYTHDAAGQVTEIKDPAGVVTKYEYDIMGRQSRIYNDNGLEVHYNYDALDRVSHIRYGNGVETAYAYDVDGNISGMETKAGENTLLSFAYEYDGNGNRTAKTGTQMTAGSCALDISYGYDVRGQLLEERRNGASVRYAYDRAGNRIRKTDAQGEIRYFYNAKNQLFTEEGADGKKLFSYDKQGGIIEEKNSNGRRLFSYDSHHRQIKIETENGIVQENRYDVENLRFELLENGKRTRFIYHDGELLHEEGGKENRQTGYHLGAGIEAFSRGQEVYYYQQDEQLSTAFITGRNGAVHNSYQYDAFGNVLDTSEQFSNRIRYTGQQYDDAIGQYYLRARYYNPVLGRFMQEDIYQGDGLNLYAYCANNPVKYYDPSGYDEEYYFRGTTVEFPGHAEKDYSNVSTDPSVATAYAVKSQTIYHEPGVIYIASGTDLKGNQIDSYYQSIPRDKELFVSLSPNEFAHTASISITVPEAIDILKKVAPDIEMPSHIYDESKLHDLLAYNFNKMTDDQVKQFVQESEQLRSSNC